MKILKTRSTLIKALIIHSAENNDKKLSQAEIGYGIPKDTQKILSYLKMIR